MLSETWCLLQALERSFTVLPPKHKRVHTPGRNYPCLRVRLGKDGHVTAVEDVGKEDWPSWTVMEGKKNSFPVVRVSDPLLRLHREDETWEKLGFDEKGIRKKPPPAGERLAVIGSLLDNFCGLVSKKNCSLWERLRDFKAQELMLLGEQGGNELALLEEFSVRFRLASTSPNALLNDIARQAVAGSVQGRLSALAAVEQLIVGKGPAKIDDKIPLSTVQLAFDLTTEDRYTAGLYNNRTKEKLIRKLPRELDKGRKQSHLTSSVVTGIDAFTGENAELECKTFPSVELPTPSFRRGDRLIGRKRFPLASMFSEARCNLRYGMTDAKVFPLAQDRATRLKEALEFITADERQGRTWQYVASGRFETRNGRKIAKPDLLIVYVEEKPDIDAKTAAYFGKGPIEIATKFEADAAAVCAALMGVERERPGSRLSIFIIRETSKGQTQVVLSERPTIEVILNSTARWTKAVDTNLPTVVLSLRQMEKDKQILDTEPTAPYPDQVVRLLSYQWIRDGGSPKPKGLHCRPKQPNQAVVGPNLSEVLSLMLQIEGKWESAAQRLLSLLLQRITPLLIGVFGAAHAYGPRQANQRQEPLSDYPRESRSTALRGVAVIGILLDAFKCQKEVYMENAPYLIGQVLALADTIHKDYCVVVRKGSLPNSLIGTSLMRRALDNPAAALADLAERMIEYLRWAKTAEVHQDAGKKDQRKIAVFEAKKKLRQYKVLAANLSSITLPIECNDIMKAQLLLGFLAKTPEVVVEEKY